MYATISILLTLAALTLLILALRGTPYLRKPPRRCPRCWYDLAALLHTRTCPECGRTAPSDRRLHKRRCSRKLAALALIVFLAAYATLALPRVRARGWIGAVPTPALIIALPLLPDPDWRNWNDTKHIIKEIGELRTLQAWDRWLAVRCCTTRLSRRPPGTPQWSQCEGALLWLLETQQPLSAGSRRRLWFAVAPGILMTREVWPADLPLRLRPSLEATSWFPNAYEHRLTVTLSHASEQPFTIPLPSAGEGGTLARGYVEPWTDDTLVLPPLPPGTQSTATYRLYQQHQIVWQTTVELPVTTAPLAPTDLLQPVCTDDTAAAVPRDFFVYAVHIHANPPSVRLTPNLSGIAHVLGGGVFGIIIDVCRDGQPIASGRYWTAPEPYVRYCHPLQVQIPLDGDLSPLLAAPDDDPSWTIRIRSDPETALRDFAATRYWSGEFTLTRDDFTGLR